MLIVQRKKGWEMGSRWSKWSRKEQKNSFGEGRGHVLNNMGETKREYLRQLVRLYTGDWREGHLFFLHLAGEVGSAKNIQVLVKAFHNKSYAQIN